MDARLVDRQGGVGRHADTGEIGPIGRVLITVGKGLSLLPRAAAWVLPVLWALAIHRLSSGPLDLGDLSETVAGALLGNLGHPFAFGVLAVLVTAAVAPRVRTPRGPWARLSPERAVWVVALVTFYGFTDELHQSTVEGRDASLLDLLSDFVGAFFAVRVVLLLSDERTTRLRLAKWLVAGIVASAGSAGLSTYWGFAEGEGPWPF